MKITCDTELNQIINPMVVEELFTKFESNFNNKIKNFGNTLDRELKKGFSSNSCVVNGDPVLQKEGKKLSNKAENLCDKEKNIKKIAVDAAKKQCEKELNQLANQITKKITELEKAKEYVAQENPIYTPAHYTEPKKIEELIEYYRSKNDAVDACIHKLFAGGTIGYAGGGGSGISGGGSW